MKNFQEILDELSRHYPGGIRRQDVPKALGNLISAKSLANLDSLGEGVPNSFRCRGRIVYPVQDLLNWLFK